MCGPEIGNKMASGALCAPRPAYERRRPRGQAICRRQSFDRIAREGFHRGTILRPPWKRRVRFPPPPVKRTDTVRIGDALSRGGASPYARHGDQKRNCKRARIVVDGGLR